MKYEIDVVIPNYNKINYIKKCVESLRNQTHENWRCIVVDGYSDDGSWNFLQHTAEKDERFELYQLNRIGLYKSWNYGLKKVSSPYFAVLTSDDIWEKNWLSTAVKMLKKYPGAIAAAARTKYIDSRGELGETATGNRIAESIFLDDPLSAELWDGVECAVANYFISPAFNGVHSIVGRSQILNSLLFPTNRGTSADSEWLTRMCLKGDIVYCSNTHVYWRRYEGQASAKTLVDRKSLMKEKLSSYTELRTAIKKELNGGRKMKFIDASKFYEEELVPFFYKRPPLKSFRGDLIGAISQSLKAAIEHPRLFAGELRSFLLGRERKHLQIRKELIRSVIECEK